MAGRKAPPQIAHYQVRISAHGEVDGALSCPSGDPVAQRKTGLASTWVGTPGLEGALRCKKVPSFPSQTLLDAYKGHVLQMAPTGGMVPILPWHLPVLYLPSPTRHRLSTQPAFFEMTATFLTYCWVPNSRGVPHGFQIPRAHPQICTPTILWGQKIAPRGGGTLLRRYFISLFVRWIFSLEEEGTSFRRQNCTHVFLGIQHYLADAYGGYFLAAKFSFHWVIAANPAASILIVDTDKGGTFQGLAGPPNLRSGLFK